MGIKDLWNLLSPYCERKPLFELSNKAIAIDLSGWVCESLCVVDYCVHPRFYLRNLFFRTTYLLFNKITPVFVLEGSAPPLKYGVILKRNQETQFRGARPRKEANIDKGSSKKDEPANSQKQVQKRNHFHYVLKQCEDLLKAMGLDCLQGPGEAEAFCAYLNSDGLVDGIISQDSDCFAYGATRVFRNFSASANGGFVDIYDLNEVNKSIDLRQEKIVVMGLLSGCDYCPNGIEGIGKESVYKLIKLYPSEKIIQMLKSWRNRADHLTELEVKVEDKGVCSNCGHQGRMNSHSMRGCLDCGKSKGCDPIWKEQRLEIKAELDIKRKAIRDPEFPSQAILDEFLLRPCEIPPLNLKWKQPNFIKFMRNSARLLQWDEIYCFQKFFPLFTRWQIMHLSDNENASLNVFLDPGCIKKKRAPKGIASYEIVWKDEKKIFDGLIPDDQITTYLNGAGNTLETLWSTIEPENLINKAYPDLVDAFLESKGKKPKATKKTDKVAKKAPKEPKKKKTEKPKNLIEKFFKRTRPAENKENDMNSSLNNFQDMVESINEIDPSQTKRPRSSSRVDSLKKGTNYSSLENLDDLMNSICEIEDNCEKLNKSRNENKNKTISSLELEMLYYDDPNASTIDLSAIWDTILTPEKEPKRKKFNESLQLEENYLQNETLKKMHNYSFVIDENEQIERRLLLKDDIVSANDSNNCLDLSLRPTKRRESFFFEPIVIDDDFEEYNQRDMFECSLLIKDQVVVEEDKNHTIIYDIDF